MENLTNSNSKFLTETDFILPDNFSETSLIETEQPNTKIESLAEKISYCNFSVTQTQNPPTSYISVLDMIEEIKHNKHFELLTNNCRSLQNKAQKEFKLSAPYYMFSVMAKNRIKPNETITDLNTDPRLIRYTRIIQIDIDGLTSEQLEEYRLKLQSDPYILFCYVSISGKGLKAGITNPNPDPNSHKEAFLNAEYYFRETYNIELDKSTKDLFRACFISSDPKAFVNYKAIDFDVVRPTEYDNIILEEEKAFIDYRLKQSPNIATLTKLFSSDPKAFDFDANDKSELIIEKRLNKILLSAVNGTRHNARLKAGRLAGGYISGGLISEWRVLEILRDASDAIADNYTTTGTELNAILDGIKHGKQNPIKSLTEKSYAKFNSIKFDPHTGEVIEFDNSELPFCFWYEDSKSELKINQLDLYGFLRNSGFMEININKLNHLELLLVQCNNNIIKEVDIDYIKRFIKDAINKQLPELISDNYSKKDLELILLKGADVYINSKKLFELDIKQINFVKDTKEVSYDFFRNGFTITSKQGTELKPYTELKNYIWESQIKQFDISIIENTELINSFVFNKFLQNVCTSKAGAELNFDSQRYESLNCCIGYLLHTYKNTANRKAIVLSEASILENPNGQTGKGLIMRGLSKIRKVSTIDGKNFKSDSSFKFQNLTLDTQIVFIDDVQKNFDFEYMFSDITEGLTFEKKNQNSFHFDITDTPNIAISTNYGLQGVGGSHEARKFELELTTYYSKNFTPYNEFGAYFFEDWSNEQWNIFYNLMLSKIQIYFNNNCNIPNYKSATINNKKLLSATCNEFFEFSNNIKIDTEYNYTELFNSYRDLAGLDDKFNKKQFSNYLKTFAELNGLTLKKRQNATGAREMLYKFVVSNTSPKNTNTTQNTQIPFLEFTLN